MSDSQTKERVLRSGESAEPLPGEGRPPIWPKIAKWVGYSTLSLILGVGVAVVGDNKPESIGSALIGILFVVMVAGSSGVNGFWNPKNEAVPEQASPAPDETH